MTVSIWKKSLAVVLSGVLAFSLSACSSQDAAGGDASSGKVIKVAYRKFGSGNKGLENWLKSSAAEFEKAHPGVKVKLVPIQASEADFFAKMALTMKSPATAPEVVTEDTFMISSDAAAGYLEPLDRYVSGWDEWNQFFEPVQRGMKAEDGKIYGVPYSTDTRGLYYNTNIFKKAGLPVPWQPKTWEDVLAAARAIKQKVPGVTPFWANVGKATGEATTMQTFEMLLYGTKDRLYENGKWVVKSPGFLDSLKFIDQIFKSGLGPELSQVLTGQAGDIVANQMMPQEKVGIVLNGNWVPAAWKETGPAPWKEGTKVYQFAPMPTQHGEAPGHTSMSGGWALSIGAKSKEKDLGMEFIKIATNKEHQKQYSLTQGDLTPRKDVAEDPEYMNAPGTVFKQATSFLEFTHYRPGNSQYPSVSTQIQAAVEAVAIGTLTPEKAMDQFAQNVKRMVGADKTVEK
ncbi:extracellular solute-binding protein [Lihuaxuella thermophila]|uniref:Multiple sugar transport system substrate-binding protein n=1 Tax=Lihuaxuella thermophila TaxID=1173111 RepID=A0A1H8GTU8_9BACL|nr:extracellular solute-binding protein [Lihuaxuella thermophila]SEN47209.1 multiple sugar transport system substrate-binding protein [Lihuaxuella thermophila]